jgi:RNA polymerase sigma factor (TIGR02999 family)
VATDVTNILIAIEQGDPRAAEQLLPLVYDELRKLAAVRIAREEPGQTLQATALVHEAYVRLVDHEHPQEWDSRGHFFAAAATAMRRILVDRARKKDSLKRGGPALRSDIDLAEIATSDHRVDVCELDDALQRLASRDQEAAKLVELRFFAGLTLQDSANAMGISARTADRLWVYARSFLLKELRRRD